MCDLENLENRSYFAHLSSFALFERAKERSLFCRSSEKSDKKSERSLALFKRAITISLFCKERRKEQSLFLKERLSKRSHNRSFEKSGNERRANEQMSDCPTLRVCVCQIKSSLIRLTHYCPRNFFLNF